MIAAVLLWLLWPKTPGTTVSTATGSPATGGATAPELPGQASAAAALNSYGGPYAGSPFNANWYNETPWKGEQFGN